MAGATFNPNAFAGANSTSVVALAAAGGAVNALNGSVVTYTPDADATLTAAVAPAGSEVSLIVLTSGTTSYTITFGTGFKSTGTLATGTTTARTFVVRFVSNGTAMLEVSRTTAMA